MVGSRFSCHLAVWEQWELNTTGADLATLWRCYGADMLQGRSGGGRKFERQRHLKDKEEYGR